MKKITPTLFGAMLAFVAIVAFGVNTPVAKAAENKSNDYSYTAQANDSLTGFVRQAIDKYTKDKQLTLSPAQRVAAETTVVNAMGAPLLDIGQSVKIPAKNITDAVEQAKKLSADQQTAWTSYANTIDFGVTSSQAAQKPTAESKTDNNKAADKPSENMTEAKKEETKDDRKDEKSGDKNDNKNAWYKNRMLWIILAALAAVILFNAYTSKGSEE